MHNYKKYFIFLLVTAIVLVGGLVSSVPKAQAVANITITSAKITAGNEVTVIFNTSGYNLDTAPITAYGIANDGVASLTLASGGPARNLSSVVITPTTFTAVYTFTGAPATTNDTGSLAVNAPDAILDTNTIPDSLDHSIVSIPLTDGQAPTASTPTSTAQRLKSGTTSTSTVQSTEAGSIYLVRTGISATTQTEINTAITDHNAFLGHGGATATTAYAVTPVASLNDGLYDVVAVDTAGNVSAPFGGWLTVDNTAPTLQSWTLDMNTGHAVLTFSEPVRDSTFTAAGILIQDQAGGGDIVTLTNSTTATVSNGTSVGITLSTADLNAIKSAITAAKSIGTSYMSIPPAVIDDMVGNHATTNYGFAFQAGDYTADTTAPTLSRWTLNMDTGHAVLTFNEPIASAFFNADGITIQNAATASGGNAVTLTSIPSLSSDGISVDFTLSTADLNSIKAKSGLAKAIGTSYIAITSAVIIDRATIGNAVTAITNGSALQAGEYTADSTPPTVTAIGVNHALITDANVGSNTFAVTVDFSEPMDLGTSPTIGFTVATTFSGCGGVWGDTDTWVEVCNVVDDNVDISNVSIQVSGAKDIALNTMADDNSTGANKFDIKTKNPDIVSAKSVGAGPTAQVEITFSENISDASLGAGDFIFSAFANGVSNGVASSFSTGTTPDDNIVIVSVPTGGTIGTGETTGLVALSGVGVISDGTNTSTQTSTVAVDDGIAPTVSYIHRSGATTTNATSVDFSVKFSEPVTDVKTNGSDFSTSGTVSGSSVTGVVATGDTSIYTVSVNTGTGDGTLGLNVLSGPGVMDITNNNVLVDGSVSDSQTYTIDKTAPATPSSSNGSVSGGSNYIPSPVATPIISPQGAMVAGGISGYFFPRNLRPAMTGSDVKQLQIFLNGNGFLVAKTGPGSPGKETNKFGQATKSALKLFQEAHTNEILTPQGLKQGTGFFLFYSRNVVNSILAK